MKIITIPQHAAEINALLAQARQEDLLLRSADGCAFILGAVEDFDEEIARTLTGRAWMPGALRTSLARMVLRSPQRGSPQPGSERASRLQRNQAPTSSHCPCLQSNSSHSRESHATS
jgi:hypothetical protein